MSFKLTGLGIKNIVDINLLIPDDNKSIHNGGITALGSFQNTWIFKQLEIIANKYDFDLKSPINKIPDDAMEIILNGGKEKFNVVSKSLGLTRTYEIDFEGIINFILNQYSNAFSKKIKTWSKKFMRTIECEKCCGSRLNENVKHFKIDHKDITEISKMDFDELFDWIKLLNKKISEKKLEICQEIIVEIKKRVEFIRDVGLNYLSIGRETRSLSGGESQRIRLATQIGSRLQDVLYILDEPSIGLHQIDNLKLIKSLKKLRDLGNTVIVVEHDREIMLQSDHLIDLGPGAGEKGGEIVFNGKTNNIKKISSITSDYLFNKQEISRSSFFKTKSDGKLILSGCTGNNLKNVELSIPLGKIIGICGLSGSGKSSLINKTLYPILSRAFYSSTIENLPYSNISGIENIDKVIKIIRSSKNPEEAKNTLIKTKWKITKSAKLIKLVDSKNYKGSYNLSETQVTSILELRLQKLTALGINEIEEEIKKLSELITKYKKIINSKNELLKVISNELSQIKEKFSSPRRTQIIDAVLNYNIEETIQKESVIITITLQGYIKRGALSNVKQQKRGGKGKTGIKTRDEDSVVQTLSVNTHTSVLFFSTEGLAYKVKAWKIPEGSAASKGKSLFNILPLKNHQSISSIMPFPDSDVDTKDMHIIFATSEGKIRKNNLEDFTSINASGKIAMKLDGNDKIIGVKICRDDQDIILSTKLGKCIRFESKKLRVFKGRSSKGIRGINLAENDTIVSLSIIDHDSNKKAKTKDQKSEIKAKEKFILSITENGYGKRTSHYDYRVTNRGGKGIIGIVNSQRNGNVSSSFPVFEGDQILISTNKGRVIRTAVKEIRIAGRNTQGVRIIKLTGDEKVVSAIKLDDNLI